MAMDSKKIVNGAKTAGRAVGGVITGAGRAVGGAIAGAGRAVSGAFTDAGNALGQLWGGLSGAIDVHLAGLEIDNNTLNHRMYNVMRQLMAINILERNKRLEAAANGGSAYVGGNPSSNNIQTSIPPYVETDYLTYTRFLEALIGDENTTSTLVNEPNNYKGVELYTKTENLYPSENGIEDNRTWNTSNPNSLLYKTQQLFKNNKINTIISRYYSKQGVASQIQTAVTKDYGMSRGRNLLTKDAENGYSGIYDERGYENPYCRAWTNANKYDKIEKAMRPFNKGNGKATLAEVHKWSNFDVEGNQGWKWKKSESWEKSVLDSETTTPTITPSYGKGGHKNVHTKQCMFSIENLAWRDYDPYSFEKCLSWEQRGPLGGRIMWFPPYGVTFSETSSTSWNQQNFIGRGEPVYTYSNTERSGTLSFMMLVDHPSVLDYVSWYEPNHEKIKDTDILRFFAGCDDISSESSLFKNAQPTPLTDEYYREYKPYEEYNFEAEGEEKKIKFYVFFPNNYSGAFDIYEDVICRCETIRDYETLGKINVENQDYFLLGKEKDETNRKSPIEYLRHGSRFEFEENGLGYEMQKGEGKGISGVVKGNDTTNAKWFPIFLPEKRSDTCESSGYTKTKDSKHYWYYRADGVEGKNYDSEDTIPYDLVTECVGQSIGDKNYQDTNASRINYSVYDLLGFSKLINESALKEMSSCSDNSCVVSMDDFFSFLLSEDVSSNDEGDIYESKKSAREALDKLFDYGKDVTITVAGFANSHGQSESSVNNNKKPSILGQKRNQSLAYLRALSVKKEVEYYINKKFGNNKVINQGSGVEITTSGIVNLEKKKNSVDDVNTTEAKLGRYAVCTITVKKYTDPNDWFDSMKDKPEMRLQPLNNNHRFGGGAVDKDGKPKGIPYKSEADGRIWYLQGGKLYVDTDYYQKAVENAPTDFKTDRARARVANDNENGGVRAFSFDYANVSTSSGLTLEEQEQNIDEAIKKGSFDTPQKTDYKKDDYNRYRYDQEYMFYKRVEKENPHLWDRLMKKIQYFNPAYHSMTPEGFNARLTFLHQCTRQGSTYAFSDTNNDNGKPYTASNLAFGKPPFCVLRLGDFFNQLIVIKSINFTYDPDLLWDMNAEGIGMQPMLCKISIQFSFIGGADLNGPVRRLQNAVSFNYYANTSLYDNRADIPQYNTNDVTQGAINNGGLDLDKSYAYNPQIIRRKDDNKKK